MENNKETKDEGPSPPTPFRPQRVQMEQFKHDDEEKMDEKDEDKHDYPDFLTVRHSDIDEANGTYFYVTRGEGERFPVWAKDGWKITFGPGRYWGLYTPGGDQIGRTARKGDPLVPPTTSQTKPPKWCMKLPGVGSWQPGKLEIVEILVFAKGEEVLAQCGSKWYLANVSKVHNDDFVDVRWQGERTKTSNLSVSKLRKTRRIKIKIRFENFETTMRAARVKVPLAWAACKLRDLIGTKTLVNFISIKLFHNDDQPLPNHKTLSELGLKDGDCLLAKRTTLEYEKKEDSATWSNSDSCESMPDLVEYWE